MDRPLSQEILAGNRRAAARLMRLVDDGSTAARDTLGELFEHTGDAFILGVTGNPGSGKSTLVNQLIDRYRAQGKTVGCIAVDPTSPFSGGAILGDRVRMQQHAGDDGVFIRSVATRGHMGGLSRSTPAMVQVLDAMGFDVIIVETVGVGQDEVEIVRLADTSLVVLVPGLGDDIQADKAGLMEIADIFVINKSDLDGATRLKREINTMLALHRQAHLDEEEAPRRPAIVTTTATTGDGVDELVDAIATHRDEVAVDGALRDRRRSAHLVRAIARTEIEFLFEQLATTDRFSKLIDEVVQGSTDPYAAAAELTNWLGTN